MIELFTRRVYNRISNAKGGVRFSELLDGGFTRLYGAQTEVAMHLFA